MAGQFLEQCGNFTSGTWDKGVSTSTSQITYFSGGTREGDLVFQYLDAIAISEDGSAIIQLTVIATGNSADYTLLAGTTDGEVQTKFEFGNNHRLIFKTTATDTEWFHYDQGGTFPYNGGVQTFDEFVGDYSVAPWDLGIDTAAQEITFFPAAIDGSLYVRLVSVINTDMICISESNGIVIQETTIGAAHKFNYALLDGATNTEVQDNFESPNRFRVILKDTDSGSEWFYYDAGGAFPFVAPGNPIRVTRQAAEVVAELTETPAGRVTRQAAEVVSDLTETPIGRVTRTALEVTTSIIETPIGRVTRTAIEVVSSVAVIINQADGTTVTRMEGFGTISDDSADLLANGWEAAGGTRSIAGGRFGGNGYKLNGLAQVIAEFAGSVANQARWGVTYWSKWTTIGATSNIYHLSDSAVTGTMPSGNTAHANVALNADGSLELFTAGVSRGSTSAGLIVATTWHHIEIRVFIDDSLGEAQVWVDGNSVISASTVDTLLGTTTNVTTNISGGTSTECIIDDLLLSEGTTAPINLHQIHELLPTGAGDNSAWDGTFADVDDPLGSPDGDTTVIDSQTALAKQDHTFPALPGVITAVFAVELVSRARVNESAPFDIVQYSISGATETAFAAQGLIGTYVLKTDRHNEDPNTAAPWEVAGVNALKAGAQIVDS